MLVVRTADKSEAWRCRIAMFTGIVKTVTVNGVEINGIVRSIKQDTTNDAPVWIMSILEMEAPEYKPSVDGRRKRSKLSSQ